MNFLSMFADSVHYRELQEAIQASEGDLELGQALMEIQGTVNIFLSAIGINLVSDFVADTYMLYGDPFSTENVKIFSVAAIMFNRGTGKQESFVIPFRLVLKSYTPFDNGVIGHSKIEAGIYLNM